MIRVEEEQGLEDEESTQEIEVEKQEDKKKQTLLNSSKRPRDSLSEHA